MPKRTDIESILIIGAGPIIIGQACEFDYSGAQACKALQGGGLPRHPREFESRDHHDRPGDGRLDLHRAHQLAHAGAHHREGRARRAAAHHGRPDGAEHRARPGARRRAGAPRRRAHRRFARSHRHGRGPRAVPQRHARNRPRVPARRRGAHACAGRRDSAEPRLPLRHPPVVHHGRLGRRHRLQPRRVRTDRRARPRCLADFRSAHRRIGDRLERIRDGGRSRQERQLHHRLLDRKPRSHGRAHRRLDHRRARADAHGQGIPAHAQRVDRGAAQDRRRNRRLERAVRGEPEGRPPAGHRDESARLALVGAGVQGHGIPDREDRREARRRLHAR